MSKPKLGRFEAFINPKHITVTSEGAEDETHELKFDLHDDFHFFPAPWDTEKVRIEFDGGHIEVTRERFYEALAKYELTYKKRTHHAAIEELVKACNQIKDVKNKLRYQLQLENLKKTLDKEREA